MFGELDEVTLFVRVSVKLIWNIRNLKYIYLPWIVGGQQFLLILFIFLCLQMQRCWLIHARLCMMRPMSLRILENFASVSLPLATWLVRTPPRTLATGLNFWLSKQAGRDWEEIGKRPSSSGKDLDIKLSKSKMAKIGEEY